MSEVKRYFDEKVTKISEKLGLDWCDVHNVLMEIINDPFFGFPDGQTVNSVLLKAQKWDEHEKLLENNEMAWQLQETIWPILSGKKTYDFVERLKLAEQILNDAVKDGVIFDFSDMKSSLPKLLDDYIHGFDLSPADYYSLEQSKLCEYITYGEDLDDFSSKKYIEEINDILKRIKWKNPKEQSNEN